jgi:ribosome-associated heat shock protein Hsp15
MAKQGNGDENDKVRLDKWLWAARFYKTRAIAKQAIDGGKVHCDGARAKPGKEVTTGLTITLRQGFDERTVVVTGLSQQRRGATEAQSLYQETPDSVRQRELKIAQRKAMPEHLRREGRPSKKDRRLIHRFRRTLEE